MDDKSQDRRRAKRYLLQTKVEFFVDADIIMAKSIDISETGIRFETETPIIICMRMELGGKLQDCMAQLVWARRDDEDGSMTYGFEYIPDTDEYVF